MTNVVYRRHICPAFIAVFVFGLSCDGTKSQISDQQSGSTDAKLHAEKSSDSDSQRSKLDDPEYKAALDEGEKLASLSPQERRARWFADDPVPRKGQPIGQILPQISAISAISANLADDEGKPIHVQIPKSKWQDFYELLIDSEPVELESEILIIAYFEIAMVDGTKLQGGVLSMFANPVLFAVENPKSPKKWWIYFATTQSELAVLNFFESCREKSSRSALKGWYPYHPK